MREHTHGFCEGDVVIFGIFVLSVSGWKATGVVAVVGNCFYMEAKRRYDYRIEPRDVDFTRRATVMSLVDYILHTAGEDADRNGFGVRDLNMHNASWVLTRLGLETYRMPEEYEDVSITTWVSDVSRAMTTRNFEVLDSDGGMVAAAVTNWAMIDLSARRMLDLHTLPAYDSMTQPFPVPVEMPRRLAAVREPQNVSVRKVAYSDLDFNCHTNSVKYVEWVVDTLPLEVVVKGRMERLDINFMHETRYGDALSIASAEAEGTRCFEILAADGTPACRMALRFSRE